MANWKVNFFFTIGKYGWSETYYTLTEEYLDAKVRALSLAERRQGTLANDVTFAALRISDDNFPGDSDVFVPTLTTPKIGKIALDAPFPEADFPFVAGLIRAQAGLKYRRQLYLRGFPDEATHPLGDDGRIIQGNFLRALNLFVTLLGGGTWSLKALSKEAVPGRVNILNAIPNTTVGGVTDVTTDQAIGGVGVGDKVRIYGTNRSWKINKIQTVVAFANRTYSLNTTTATIEAWNRKGTAKKASYIYPAINSAVLLRFTHRDTGRPFDSTRGRRPVAR